MVNAIGSVDVHRSSLNKSGSVSNEVQQDSATAAVETLISSDELTEELARQAGSSPAQLGKELIPYTPELQQYLDQLSSEEHARLDLFVSNIAQFYAAEQRDAGSRTAYPLEQIFANGGLDDTARGEAAQKDLLEAGYDHGFVDGQMSSSQQETLLRVHNMFPNKGAFELTYTEKKEKILALQENDIFTKEQAKLLLDRGYAGFGFLKSALSGVLGVVKRPLVIGSVVAAFLFWYVGGCDAVKWTGGVVGDVATTTRDLVEPIVKTGTGVIEYGTGGLSHLRDGLQSIKLKKTHLEEEKADLAGRLETIKLEIQTINDQEPWYKRTDGDREDMLQGEEEKLEKRLLEIDQELMHVDDEMRELSQSKEKFDVPNKVLIEAFEEKRGDAKDWTGEQWDKFEHAVKNAAQGPGGTYIPTPEEQTKINETIKSERTKKQIEEKGYEDEI